MPRFFATCCICPRFVLCVFETFRHLWVTVIKYIYIYMRHVGRPGNGLDVRQATFRWEGDAKLSVSWTSTMYAVFTPCKYYACRCLPHADAEGFVTHMALDQAWTWNNPKESSLRFLATLVEKMHLRVWTLQGVVRETLCTNSRDSCSLTVNMLSTFHSSVPSFAHVIHENSCERWWFMRMWGKYRVWTCHSNMLFAHVIHKQLSTLQLVLKVALTRVIYRPVCFGAPLVTI